MSESLTKLVIDVQTGEQAILPLTPEEITQIQRWADEQATEVAMEEIRNNLKESAKAKLIAGEPLTPEEADCLVL